jgi:hypothetical protein
MPPSLTAANIAAAINSMSPGLPRVWRPHRKTDVSRLHPVDPVGESVTTCSGRQYQCDAFAAQLDCFFLYVVRKAR